MWSELKKEWQNPKIKSMAFLVLLVLALAVSLQQINQRQLYQKKAAQNLNPRCYQPCGEDSECGGLICGRDWCLPGSPCTQLLRCYQETCPLDRTCDCSN